MARTALTPTAITAHGTVTPAAAAVDQANGNQFANPTGRALIEVTNGAGSPITITFTTSANYIVTGGTTSITYPVADDVQTVTNGTTKTFGPFDRTLYNDTNGNVLVDYSSGTSITARVLELGLA